VLVCYIDKNNIQYVVSGFGLGGGEATEIGINNYYYTLRVCRALYTILTVRDFPWFSVLIIIHT
jgi:hypothetical protein